MSAAEHWSVLQKCQILASRSSFLGRGSAWIYEEAHPCHHIHTTDASVVPMLGLLVRCQLANRSIHLSLYDFFLVRCCLEALTCDTKGLIVYAPSPKSVQLISLRPVYVTSSHVSSSILWSTDKAIHNYP